MNIKEMIKSHFYDETKLNKKDYEKGRELFIYEGCAAVGIFAITSGAFLAGFAKYLGASDEFNGLLAAIPAVAGIIQIFSSLVFEKIKHRKFLISILCLAHRLLLGFMLLTPIFIKGTILRLVVGAVIYSLAYSMASFLTPAASNWIVDLTPDHKRGSFFAKKDIYSLTFVTLLTLVMGKLMDIFRKSNHEYGGFIMLAIVVLILSLINFYILSKIKEPILNRKINTISIKNVLTMALKNRGFRKVIGLSILWSVSLQIGGPFLGVYMVTGLKLSYSYIMLMGVLSSVARVATAKIWGNLGDRKSWFFTTRASLIFLGIGHTLWALADARSAYILIPLLHIIGGVAWAGLNTSMFNLQFIYAPEEGRTAYLGTSAALGGVAGFIGTFLASILISMIGTHKFKFSGFLIGNMQVAFALSGILILFTALYVYLVMEKSYKKA